MSPTEWAALITAVGMGGAITTLINAWMQRRKVSADAAAVLVATAKELVDPLRRELAAERAEHSVELEVERQKVIQVRDELQACVNKVHSLHAQIGELQQQNERYLVRIRDLEAQLK